MDKDNGTTVALNGETYNDHYILRLFVKTNEYVYIRPNDILLIESANHMVKVYVAMGRVCKKVFRHNTLKEFLAQLPSPQFIRLGRFYAINTRRVSAGNSKQQTFEFDFSFTVKVEHSLPNSAFTCIGK